MDNLRLTLLITGCLIVLGIYLWEIFGKTKPKKKTDILDAVDDFPDLSPTPFNNNESENYSSEANDLASLLTESRDQGLETEAAIESLSAKDDEPLNNNTADEEPPLPLDMSVSDYEAGLTNENDYDVFAAIEEEVNSQGNLETEPQAPVTEDELKDDIPNTNKESDDIIVLYITSPAHTLFNGLSISKAADEVGMIYGHMNIFHHFGPGKLHSGQPLFSIANMHEPGSFDLGRMADLQTKGIAAFMYSPASIDASVVFELYLNTTQRIAELLGGEVRTSNNEILDSASINSLREKAASFSET